MKKRESIWTSLVAIALVTLTPFFLQLLWQPPPEPAPMPEMVEAPPKPAPAPPPVEPTPRTPQEALAAQVIDETHDAFLVHTHGRMGTLLVTAEWEVREGVGYSSYRIWRLDDLETPMQEFSQVTQTFGVHQTVDANFDGAEDFGWEFSAGTSTRSWLYYLWDEEQGQFVYSDELGWISMPVFYQEEQLVSSWIRYGYCGGQFSWYQWEEDRLCLLRSVCLDKEDSLSTRRKLTISIGVNGYPAQIYQERFSGDDAAIEASKEAWGKWTDLDYFDGREELCDFLAQQPIDETHDAFLIDTRGERGTLLVTVTRADSQEIWDVPVLFEVWDPAHMEAPIQTMESVSSLFRWKDVLDANFDGYMDFAYGDCAGNQPVYYNLWVWHEDQGQFVLEPEYHHISCPHFDAATETIYGFNRTSGGMGTGVCTIHKWENGELVCFREAENYIDLDSDKPVLVVKERVNGVLTEIFRKEYEPDPEGRRPDMTDREKWSNLDYHGESQETY